MLNFSVCLNWASPVVTEEYLWHDQVHDIEMTGSVCNFTFWALLSSTLVLYVHTCHKFIAQIEVEYKVRQHYMATSMLLCSSSNLILFREKLDAYFAIEAVRRKIIAFQTLWARQCLEDYAR